MREKAKSGDYTRNEIKKLKKHISKLDKSRLEQKKIERALIESEKRYKTLILNIPVGIFRSTSDGRIISVNSALARMFGYPKPLEMSNLQIKDLYISPDDRMTFIKTISSRGAISNYEVQQKRRDGTIFWCSISARAIKDKEGNIIFIDGVLENITERKKTEMALKTSETLNRAVIENLPLGISIRNKDGNLISANEAWRKIWGFTKREFKKFIAEQIEFDFGPTGSEHLLRHMSDIKRVFDFGGELILRDLKIKDPKPYGAIWITNYFYSVKNDKEEVEQVVILTEDETERKFAEEELRTSEERYRVLFENAPIGIYRTTPDGSILIVNPALLKMLGYASIRELNDKNVEKNGYANPETRIKFKELIEEKGEVKGYEASWNKKDGSLIYVRENARAIRDEDGRTLYYEGTVEDITEKKISEQVQEVQFKIANSVNISQDMNELYSSIHEHLSTVLDTTNFFITLYNKEMKTFTLPYYVDERNSFTSMPVKKTLTSYMIRHKKPLLIKGKDIRKLIEMGKVAKRGIGIPAKVWLGVPLKIDEEIIGAIVVQSYRDEAIYTERDLNILRFVSEQIATAIERKSAEEERDQHRLELQSLFEGSDILMWSVWEDTNGELYYGRVNTAFSKSDGLTPDDFYGKKITDLHPPNEVNAILRSVEMAKKGKPHIYERKLIIKGEFRYLSIRFIPLVEPDGQIKHFIGIGIDITERILVEEALKESEMSYRSLQANIPVGIFRSTADPSGQLLTTNSALANMFGYESPEDMSDIHVANLYQNPKDRKKFLKSISTTGEISDYEVQFKRRDGTTFWGSLYARAIKDKKGKVIYLDGILEDITERKTSEKIQLVLNKIANAVNITKDLNELFRSIQEHLGLIMDTTNFYIALYNKKTNTFSLPYHLDAKDRFTTFPAGKSLTYYIISNDLPLLVNNKEIEKMVKEEIIERVGAPSKVWLGVPLKIGREVIGAVVVQSYTDEVNYTKKDLEILKFVSDQIAIAIDRKKWEEALLESEEKYRTLVEQATDGVIIIQDYNIKFVNTALCTLFGYKENELIGRSFLPLLAKEARDTISDYYRIRMKGENIPSIYETSGLHKNGYAIPLELNAALIRYEGKPADLVIIRDITDRKRAEQELKNAFNQLEKAHRELKKLDAAKTEFLNITSHELRSPLTSILGYAEVINDGLNGPLTDAQRESTEIIMRNAIQLSRYVDDLLDFTQMETGRLRLDKEICDVESIISNAVESMMSTIEEMNCKLALNVSPDLPVIKCDTRRITQVLYNLIINAAKFSPKGGVIKIDAGQEDDFIKISVSDEGIGISEEDQKKIFEKFYQVDMSDSRKARGMGLGLSISKAIVEEHGGTIGLESKPGKGSTFYFTIPVSEKDVTE
jgi:PAS domain S-box-containing protein